MKYIMDIALTFVDFGIWKEKQLGGGQVKNVLYNYFPRFYPSGEPVIATYNRGFGTLN